MYITSKRIKLEGPGWSGFVPNSKPDQPGLSRSVRLEVMCLRTKLNIAVM